MNPAPPPDSLEGLQSVKMPATDGPTGRWNGPVTAGTLVGFFLALALGAVFTARTMQPALAADAVQDDARQHIFWMARYRDPALFQNDPIAAYFEATAPPAYFTFYRVLLLAIDPIPASKLVACLLGLATAGLTFGLARRLGFSPSAALLASALLCWFVWQGDDLAGGTARGFVLPLLAGQVWALAADRALVAAGLTALATAFHPVGGTLGLALQACRLVRWSRPGLLVRSRRDWLAFVLAAMCVGGLVWSQTTRLSPFGPLIGIEQARTMPEFGPAGAETFFGTSLYRFVLQDHRTGFDLRRTDPVWRGVPILAELLALALLLPLLALAGRRRGWPVVSGSTGRLLAELLAVSVGLFLLAHLVLFRLYLPNRFVKFSVPLALALAAGLALGHLVELPSAHLAEPRRQRVRAALTALLLIGLLAYPALNYGRYFIDLNPTVTASLRKLPADTLVAGVPFDTDMVPSLARRPVLTSFKYTVPFHLGYYLPLRERGLALAEAYYAPTNVPLLVLGAQYGVDVFLVNRLAFQDRAIAFVWSNGSSGNWEPYVSTARTAFQRANGRFALLDAAKRCARVDDGQLALVTVECIERSD